MKDYLKRDELLKVLSQMDFNVNFMYDPTKYAPSKVIDYLIADRPILNIDYELDTQNLDKFLSGNYEGAKVFFPISKFDIKRIANLFLDL